MILILWHIRKLIQLIDMNEKSVLSLKSKIQYLKNNEAILILQEYQNAKMFDIGILEKKIIILIYIKQILSLSILYKMV